MAVLRVKTREDIGTRRARRLRQQGQIPGIIYGHGEDPQPITLDRHEVELAIQHGQRLLEIDNQGASQNVLIKEVQYDTYGLEILHVDLTRVRLDERVEVTVPLVLRGTPAGAEEGGVIQQVVSEISIECLVTTIPDEIRASVTELKLGDTLHMRDIALPEGARLLDEPDLLVCTVAAIAEEAEAAEEAGPEEPEVLRERKAEEESEE